MRITNALTGLAALLVASLSYAQAPPSPPAASTVCANTTLAVTGSSARVALPSTTATCKVVTLVNDGTSEVFVKFGDNTVTATTNDIPIPAGASPAIWTAGTYVAAISAGGSSNLRVIQGNGPLAFRGGSGGSTAAAITPLFGMGYDSDSVCSSTVTLGRDMHYRNLTLAAGCKLNTASFRIFVQQVLDISNAPVGAITNWQNGNNASGATGGANTGAQTAPLPVWGQPNTGGTGTATVGGNGSTIAAASLGNGGSSGIPATGGTCSSAAGTVTATPVGGTNPGAAPIGFNTINLTYTYFMGTNANVQPVWFGFAGNGGSAGGGDGTGAGGGGGSGGRPTMGTAIYANVINRGTNTNQGIISARGGDGGKGGDAVGANACGGGGGAAAGGGFVYIVVGSLAGSQIVNAIDVSGGKGGDGGNGLGTGKGGNGGGGGRTGNVQILLLDPPALQPSSSFNVAGTAGGTTATATGATGGAGASLFVNL